MLQPVPPSLPAWLDLFVDSGAEVCYQLPGYIHWLAALRVLYYFCNTALFGNLSSKLVNLPSFLSTLILIMMVMLMTVNLSLVTWFILELLQLFGAASSKKAKLPNARSRIYCSSFLPVSMRLSGFKPFFVSLDFKSLYLYRFTESIDQLTKSVSRSVSIFNHIYFYCIW